MEQKAVLTKLCFPPNSDGLLRLPKCNPRRPTLPNSHARVAVSPSTVDAADTVAGTLMTHCADHTIVVVPLVFA